MLFNIANEAQRSKCPRRTGRMTERRPIFAQSRARAQHHFVAGPLIQLMTLFVCEFNRPWTSPLISSFFLSILPLCFSVPESN